MISLFFFILAKIEAILQISISLSLLLILQSQNFLLSFPSKKTPHFCPTL